MTIFRVGSSRQESHRNTKALLNDYLQRFWIIHEPGLSATVISVVDQHLVLISHSLPPSTPLVGSRFEGTIPLRRLNQRASFYQENVLLTEHRRSSELPAFPFHPITSSELFPAFVHLRNYATTLLPDPDVPSYRGGRFEPWCSYEHCESPGFLLGR